MTSASTAMPSTGSMRRSVSTTSKGAPATRSRASPARVHADHLVPPVPQGRGQQGHHLLFVVDHQDPGHDALLLAVSAVGAAASGSRRSATAPARSVRSPRVRVPPISSMMRRDRARPRPLPFSLVVQKGSNSCSGSRARALALVADRERQLLVPGRDGQGDHAAPGHGVAGVEQQVQHHLLQAARIALDRQRPRAPAARPARRSASSSRATSCTLRRSTASKANTSGAVSASRPKAR